ncbi:MULTISPECIES: hypothetical protein [Sphingomonas]|uniref:hypothetical protein n=1 Tax=Sphingomonas TaxID=13687 RepID=UPI00234EDD29|nr:MULTISPECIES: hypothetical protein [Sphingomonas]WCP71520.1 hypothetical protein PPZ50_14345 [Sphingomonas hankookensis]
MRLLMATIGLLLSGCGGAPSDAPVIHVETHRTDASTGNVPALPADVVAFRLKRDECDHLRGEEATGPARAAFLKYGMERTCTGTDAALRLLRQRHADDPAAIAALAGYADDIE